MLLADRGLARFWLNNAHMRSGRGGHEQAGVDESLFADSGDFLLARRLAMRLSGLHTDVCQRQRCAGLIDESASIGGPFRAFQRDFLGTVIRGLTAEIHGLGV